MKLQALYGVMLLWWFAPLPTGAQNNAVSSIPHLATRGTATQLIVDGKPFLVLGGELHNSSSSSLDYMRPILAKFAAGHLNTVLAAVGWDVIEPEEGKFDFSLVDGAIQEARRQNLRLMLLWFGSWKNGVSTYPPVWVKTDLRRFPRAQNKEGKSLEILSTFSATNRDADARAFAALMRHLRTVDSEAHTVLMIQVENEVGVLTELRDRSAAANEAFERPVPTRLPGLGKRFLAPAKRRMRSSWHGTTHATLVAWPRRAKPNTRCRCL